MSVQASDALMSIFGFERVTLHGYEESGTTEDHELEAGMSDKMREEFEAWYKKRYGSREHSAWAHAELADSWEAWQASRAALVVELPPMTNNGYDGFYPAYGVKKAIHAAGVKTK